MNDLAVNWQKDREVKSLQRSNYVTRVDVQPIYSHARLYVAGRQVIPTTGDIAHGVKGHVRASDANGKHT